MTEYIDEEGTKHTHIYLAKEDFQEYKKGWYFSDEVSQLNGPYNSLNECYSALTAYCTNYLEKYNDQ